MIEAGVLSRMDLLQPMLGCLRALSSREAPNQALWPPKFQRNLLPNPSFPHSPSHSRAIFLSMSSLPSPGTRITYQKQHIGTVRYAGPVDGTNGDWLGVEWDDAETRGKHDGVKDGKRYFHCL